MRIAFLLALVPLPALAALPEVEVEALCRDMAWTGVALSDTILSDCRLWEARAREEAERAWPLTAPRDRLHCARISAANGTGSYKALAMCVRAAGIDAPGPPHLGP